MPSTPGVDEDARWPFSAVDRTVTTRTDGCGWFRLTYRPVTLPITTDALTIQYLWTRPRRFLVVNATVDVTLRTAQPMLTVSVASETVRYNRTFRVAGTARVAGDAAARVPVVVRVDGDRFGRAITNATGGYAVAGPFPVDVLAGPRRVEVTVPLEKRAVTAANALTAIGCANARRH